MKVTLYNFSKRKNSLAVPTGGKEVECTLKETCGKYEPILILKESSNYNYLQFMGNYFYVDDIIFLANHLYEYHCNLDKYASGRNDILNSRAYVAYSSSEFNPMLSDNRLSTTDINAQTSIVNVANYFPRNAPFANLGYYIVTLVGRVGTLSDPEPSSTGTTILYMKPKELARMVDYMQIDKGEDATVQYLYGISLQMIQSIIYVPFQYPTNGTVGIEDFILLTGIDMTFRGAVLKARYHRQFSEVVEIKRPYNDYRSYRPAMTLYLPFIGTQILDTDNYIGVSQITVNCHLDYATATGYYELQGGKHFDYFPFEYGSRQPISTSSVNPVGELSKTVGAVAQFGFGVMSGNVSSVVGGVDSLFNAVIDGTRPQYNTVGSYSSGLMADMCTLNLVLTTFSPNVTTDPSDMSQRYGRPLGKIRRIGDLTGYVQTVNAHVSSFLPYELGELLDNGLYIE